MHLRKPKIKVKKKFVVIIGSLNFTDEMRRLSMILEHKGFIVLYPKPTPLRNKFRDVYQKFLTAIESCDLVMLYNHLGYIGSGTHSELTYDFKHHKLVYSINPKSIIANNISKMIGTTITNSINACPFLFIMPPLFLHTNYIKNIILSK